MTGFAIVFCLAVAPAFGQIGDDFRKALIETTSAERAKVAGILDGLDETEVTLRVSLPNQTPADDQGVKIPTSELLHVRIGEVDARLAETAPVVLLTNGDLLAAQVTGGDQEQLTLSWFDFPRLPEFSVPLEHVKGVLLQRSGRADRDTKAWDHLAKDQRGSDHILLSSGDTLRGEVAEWGNDSLKIDSQTTPGKVDRRGVVAITFNSELAETPEWDGNGVVVLLTDGSRFRAKEVSLMKQDLLRFKPAFGEVFLLPIITVASLQFVGSHAVALSERTPVDEKFTPYISHEWPWRRDRNCLGQPMAIRRQAIPFGLGVHSQQRLMYRVESGDLELRGSVGIDDSALGKGAVTFRILVDDLPVWTSRIIRGNDALTPFPVVSLAGKKRFELQVDFGPQGDILDHADWCNLMIIRESASKPSR